MKYVKAFETHNQYETYINGDGKILPNVSYCENLREVHYNPYIDPRLIAKFNVVDDSDTTRIYGAKDYANVSVLDNFTKMVADGVEISLTDLDENYGFYQLYEGEHTVKCTLADPTEIGYAVFCECSRLTSVIIPDGVTTIGNNAFYYCTELTNVVIPNSVITIDSQSFNNCSSLTNIVIPNSVTTIDLSAFSGCSGLTNITIPDSVTTIVESAFYECTGLTSVTIGNGVTTIGQEVFYGCTALTSVTIQATTPPTLDDSNAFDSTNNCSIYVPSASVNAYKSATNWSDLSSRIQAIP